MAILIIIFRAPGGTDDDQTEDVEAGTNRIDLNDNNMVYFLQLSNQYNSSTESLNSESSTSSGAKLYLVGMPVCHV